MSRLYPTILPIHSDRSDTVFTGLFLCASTETLPSFVPFLIFHISRRVSFFLQRSTSHCKNDTVRTENVHQINLQLKTFLPLSWMSIA